MLSSLSVALLGLLLGVRHAFDPDHVVAVTAIATNERSTRRAAMVGALWGLGHSATILVVGGAIILFRIAISPRLGLAMEFAVALMLIVLGTLNLLGRGRRQSASASRPVLVGMVHGLAGSAAVALLVLAAVSEPAWGLVYLLLFGLGTVVGMLGATTAIAVPTALAAARAESAGRWLSMAAGAASIAFGIALAAQIGADGLFSATPRWTPH